MSATKAPIEVRLGDSDARSAIAQRATEASVIAGWTPRPRLMLGAGVLAGGAVNTVTDYPVQPASDPNGEPIIVKLNDVQVSEGFASAKFWVLGRTLNRLGVPSRGVSLQAEFEVGRGDLDASELIDEISTRIAGSPDASLRERSEVGARAFRRGLVDFRGYLPFIRRVSLLVRVAYAHGSGKGLPFNRRNYIGGIQPVTVFPGSFLPLYGHPSQAETGPNAWIGVFGAQWRAGKDTFVRLFGNAGRIVHKGERVFESDDTLTGLGLDLIHRLPVGPLTLSVGTRDFNHWPDVGLRLGYVF